MSLEIQQIINSSFGVSLVSALGRGIPPWLGLRLSDFVAERIAAQRDSEMVQAVRANQWVISGEKLEKAALDEAVRQTFRNAARSIFDLYHNIHDAAATDRLIVIDQSIQQLFERQEFGKRGLVVAGLHISNFDFVLQALHLRGFRPMVLTIPDPGGGRRVEFEMRKRTGMNLVPVSVNTLRQAIKYLQEGGVVLTGIDRPIPDAKYRPRFFGRPASLPIHHVYLATRAQVPVMIMVINMQPDGRYTVIKSHPIEMEPLPDRKVEMLRNAEKVLSIAETFIRKVPHQWTISLPVWPEALEQVPD
jgi:KDO2-lipid IV(A) lauroyltransferase